MKDVYTLHVVERGKGRPVILVHGMMSTHRYWLEVAKLLEPKRHLWIPDLLGFGESPKPRKARYDLEQIMDCLEHTMGQHQFQESPVLVGHSMGAVIALHWAVQHPEHFCGVVLSSPTLFEPDQFHQQMATIALQGRLIKNKTFARIVTTVMGLTSVVPAPLAAQIVRYWPRPMVEDATRHRLYVFRKIMKNARFSDAIFKDLRAVQLPTRILVGEQDFTVSHALKELRDICRTNKNCTLQTVPAGHQLPIEHPETVAKVILSV